MGKDFWGNMNKVHFGKSLPPPNMKYDKLKVKRVVKTLLSGHWTLDTGQQKTYSARPISSNSQVGF